MTGVKPTFAKPAMRLPFRNAQGAHISVELLSAYLDDQLRVDDQERLERHLRDCSECRRELARLRQTVALLQAMPRVPVPRAFTLSEAQVGIIRPAARTARYGGMIGGLAAVTALALVAIVATALVRQPRFVPSQMVARVAPASEEVQVTGKPEIAAEPSSGPGAPAGAAAPVPQPAARAQIAPEAPPPPGMDAADVGAPTSEPVQSARAEQASEPTGIAPAPAAAPKQPSAASSKAQPPQPTAAQPAEKRAVAVASPPEQSTPEALSTELGRGAGPANAAASAAVAAGATTTANPPAQTRESVPALAALAVAAESGSADTLPAMASITETLPPEAGIAYASPQGPGLTLLDRESGTRQIPTAPGATSPLISSDRAWVLYQARKDGYSELWAVGWAGKNNHLVLDERDLSKPDSGKDYGERRLRDVRWVLGRHVVAFDTVAAPNGAGALPLYEAWTLDVDTGSRQLVIGTDGTNEPAFSPDGSRLALLRRGTDQAPSGNLLVAKANGGGEQTLLSLPDGLSQYSFDSQLSWLLDGDVLWAAIPDATLGSVGHLNGITLYRVQGNDPAQVVRHIDAFETFWSPDGRRLAYTRISTDAVDQRELVLADADGSNPQSYAPIDGGAFMKWSPDSTHFVYRDGSELYLGAPGQKPQTLGQDANLGSPYWIGPQQLLYLRDAGTDLLLVSRTLDGRVAGLATLPKSVTLDATD